MTDGKFVLQEKKLKATFNIDVRPSKLSQLENDIDLVNQEYVDNAIANVEVDTSNLASKEELNAVSAEIPKKTSQLTNDSGFITSIPSEYVTETELSNKGYLTSSSLDGYATKDYVDDAVKNVEVDTSDLATKEELSEVAEGKVQINQGVSNAGKILQVDADGNVSPVNFEIIGGDATSPDSPLPITGIITTSVTGRTFTSEPHGLTTTVEIQE